MRVSKIKNNAAFSLVVGIAPIVIAILSADSDSDSCYHQLCPIVIAIAIVVIIFKIRIFKRSCSWCHSGIWRSSQRRWWRRRWQFSWCHGDRNSSLCNLRDGWVSFHWWSCCWRVQSFWFRAILVPLIETDGREKAYCNPLEWWKTNQGMLPIMSQLAKIPLLFQQHQHLQREFWV